MPIDPQARKWTRLIWQLFTGICVLLIVCLLELQVILAGNHASDAGDEARGIAQCVNSVLASRSSTNLHDQVAHVTFARAQRAYAAAAKAWADSLKSVLGQRRGSPAQLQAYGQFVEESKLFDQAAAVFVDASTAYQRQLEADQAQRDRHPLGRC